jgi:hypothetical protein
MTIIRGKTADGTNVVIECAEDCPPILEAAPRWGQNYTGWFKLDGKPATTEVAQKAIYSMVGNVSTDWNVPK